MPRFRTLLIAAGVAVMAVVGVSWAWGAIGGDPMPVHGFIALSLGILGTIALTWVLMALAFRSDREGWDERADRSGGADVRKPDKS
ncbi:hypothetical protein [Brevundimonas sp.]|uniref:hypothetical protein n=1 Tax=Brevundimonas sp. TaxID=1871086 RepID=UPI002737B789|nr:hypothetical protein [Brevundimonas sp.]MDP3802739.1 hypothetical protein [Brevundimonas sp.]